MEYLCFFVNIFDSEIFVVNIIIVIIKVFVKMFGIKEKDGKFRGGRLKKNVGQLVRKSWL